MSPERNKFDNANLPESSNHARIFSPAQSLKRQINHQQSRIIIPAEDPIQERQRQSVSALNNVQDLIYDKNHSQVDALSANILFDDKTS
jgi:hypothetical protein